MSANSVKNDNYVCPACKQPLTPKANGLCCQREGVEYPIKNGIVDFVTEDLMKSASLVDRLDDLAKIYEGPSWYGIINEVHAELGLPSLEEMATMLTEMVDANDGLGLDAACGTGFVTRHLAQKMALVYGIDISTGMLEKATDYARERGIGNICFAHSRAERLPFPDSLFDGVTCSGALHTFQDTVEALTEMARVLKSWARLAVMAAVKGDNSVLTKFYARLPSSPFGEEETEALHLFDVEELRSYLLQAGFRGFMYDVYGSDHILFHAEKV
jgi:SAM-dependent methyltransferase